MTLEIQHLRVQYNGNEILSGVDLTVSHDKVIVLGPNGSGKTSLIRAVCGMTPFEGRVMVDGNDLRRLRNFMGLSTNLPEAYSLGITVRDIVYLYEELKGVDPELFKEMLNEAKLNRYIMNTPIFKLSSGQSLLVRDALALSSRPKVVVLDEPFENVDAARRGVVVRWIREYGEEGIVVTHELEMLRAFKDLEAYFLLSGKNHGPIKVSELLDSSVKEGKIDGALIAFDLGDRWVSLVKEDRGTKFLELGSLNRIYGVMYE